MAAQRDPSKITMSIFRILSLLLVVDLCSGWVGGVSSLIRSATTRLHAAANNNIVLQPNLDNDDAFDSYQIGSARVHRYSREYDPEANTEYVMWYHGRSKAQSQDPDLVPLSTGRIGRATSKNGLVWVKDTEGSLSEDASDVSLGVNTESWWGFDTAHVGLGEVLLPMSNPAVITEGGVYIMYYMGGSKEEKPVADYIQNPPDAMRDAKIQGMNMKIGIALSQDGITWGRVEGDDPTGAAVVPLDRNDPNANYAEGEEEELYCGWPDVATNLNDKDKSKHFLMYYSTMTKADKQKCLACATSKDGFRWKREGVCLRPGSGTELDAAGCARCCVIQDASFDEETATWSEVPSSWTMYYEGVSPDDNKHRIMVAKSKDAKTWTKAGLALDVGAEEDAWDVGGVGSPHVVRLDDGNTRMYYTGQGADKSTAIGVAKLAPDDAAWVREQATFSFAEGVAD